MQHAPETLDAALGLRSLRGDESDAELLESAAELSGLALAGELFVDRPVIVVADEDAAAIAVEGDGDAVAAQEALQQAEIALGGFRGEELGGEDFAGSIVLHAQSGEQGAATFEPVVGRAVELNEFAFASRAQTALAMSGRSAFAWRAEALAAEQPAQGFAAEREAFLFDELLVKMMVVEAGVACARQARMRLRTAWGMRRWLGRPRLTCARAAALPCR